MNGRLRFKLRQKTSELFDSQRGGKNKQKTKLDCDHLRLAYTVSIEPRLNDGRVNLNRAMVNKKKKVLSDRPASHICSFKRMVVLGSEGVESRQLW